ncbi:MAG TPA: polyphosphate kinase 2 family protein [Thermoanaerobaculia bacterium]|nr:polyphosphate kinase 2 family protein [Thermoanaerobaculia bacterium]
MADIDSLRVKPGKRFRLADFDPGDSSVAPGDKDETREKSDALVEELAELQELLYAEHRHRILIVLQGMDTSGKDGTVRHVMRGVSPQNVRVTSFKKPSEIELAHDYLWRVHAVVPGTGEIAIFNRSHYEDVLVVRVHELVPKDDWQKRFAHINDFERLLADTGTTILKFFLHISRDEQRKRLQERLDDPTKQWKFQHGDLEERKLWDDYQKAYEDAIEKTSTEWAPWIVVPSDRKWVRNWVVAKTLAETLSLLKMKYPKPDLEDVTVE